MKRFRMFLLVGCFVILAACLTADVKAGVWSQKTVVTFDHPVELPGIVLPAGTYVFRLANHAVDRNCVQVFSEDQQKLYAVVNAVPDYRTENIHKLEIVFEERMAGAPYIIKKWFFPGRSYGHQFVYMKTRDIGRL